MDDYLSGQNNSAATQTSAANLPGAVIAVSDAEAQPSEQAVQLAVDQINAHLAGVDRILALRVDPSSGYLVAQISNANTGEVLQQIPTEDGIKLKQMLSRWSHGGNVLMDEEA
ncbi:MAG TPA: flagellar protein FlaG [Steroidobacteraceae bacterium]|nr:flagellar protein FlaG [Steroidobacteraceae bacterium]